jgi:ABC-2 type transport system permease protein
MSEEPMVPSTVESQSPLPEPRGPIGNVWLVARREFWQQVKSRLFFVSTAFLATLAIVVALLPILISMANRDSPITVAVVSDDAGLTENTISVLSGLLNPDAKDGEPRAFVFVAASATDANADAIADGRYDGALIGSRLATGQMSYQFLTGERIGTEATQKIQVGVFAIGIFDWVRTNGSSMTGSFNLPAFTPAAVGAGSSAGGSAGAISAAEYAGRRIVGVVFVVLIFITLVIYGMWVAAGVVAEKSSRVMELLISAATPGELVTGKVLGIGLAGGVQYVAILVPALATLLLQDRIAVALLGSSTGLDLSLAALTPSLLVAYGGFWVLGFTLYALIYAAAGSLVSRAEDLQVLALPMSIIAIAGYFQAVMALSGGITPLVRFASYVPFWSPFVMLTRLTVGRVEPWELALSFGLLLASIPIVALFAIRVYSAGVLLYGQRPGPRQIVGAILNPPT